MANIEVHGSDTVNGIGSLMLKWSKRFTETDKETVITEFHSYPHSCDNIPTPAPYLRILGESKEEIEKVIQVLRELGATKIFDIETLLISSFIPKEGRLALEKKNIQSGSDLAPAEWRNLVGKKFHLGVCGNQVTDEAVLVGLCVYGNSIFIPPKWCDNYPSTSELLRNTLGVKVKVGGRVDNIYWGDIVELWPLETTDAN